MRSPTPWTLPARQRGSSATPPRVKSARSPLTSLRDGLQAALDPGWGPRPEACQQPGRQVVDRPCHLPAIPDGRSRFLTVIEATLTCAASLWAGDGTNGEYGSRFDSGCYSGGGSGWLARMDGGGVKSGCGPGLRFRPLANRSASWLRCQRRASRAPWSSMTQCQRPQRIRRLTRTGPSSAHTAVRPTGSSCWSAWAERAMAASSSPPTQPARPHWRTVSGPEIARGILLHPWSPELLGPRACERSRMAKDVTGLALAGRSNPQRCQL
jgi:hypothetical protein